MHADLQQEGKLYMLHVQSMFKACSSIHQKFYNGTDVLVNAKLSDDFDWTVNFFWLL